MTISELARVFSVLEYKDEKWFWNGLDVTNATPKVYLADPNGMVGNCFSFEWPSKTKEPISHYEITSITGPVELTVSKTTLEKLK